MTRIELIAEDVARLRAAYPELGEAALREQLVGAALAHRDHEWDPTDPFEGFVHDAAALASYRQRLAGAEPVRVDMKERERMAYEAKIELDRDVIPPLKQEAKRLRSEIRRLEASLRAKGVDPSTIEPVVEGPTIAMDDYEPPRYLDPAERRRQVGEFFRRVGGDR